MLQLIQAYSAPCVTLVYSQSCHFRSPSIFRTGGLFKTLWNVDQAYSEPCHRALFSHIQVYSEPCARFAYTQTWHTQNPGIFRSLPQLHPNAYSEPRHIKKNLQIFRTLTYLKPDSYSEPSQKFKIESFAEIVTKYNYFSKVLHIRPLTLIFWIRLSLIKYSLTCRVTSRYVLYDIYSEPCLLPKIQTLSGIFTTY